MARIGFAMALENATMIGPVTHLDFSGDTDSDMRLTYVQVLGGQEDWRRQITLRAKEWDRVARLIRAALDGEITHGD